jgi:hypothetical protein
MSLSLFKYVCARGHTFEAADASGEYGEFVMRGERSAEPALLRALEDSAYREVDALLQQSGALRGKSDLEQAELLQAVFGVACDPAPDGTRPKLNRQAPCPVCGTRQMASWEPSGPYTGSSFAITHAAWDALTKAQKLVQLEAAVKAETGGRASP